MGIFRKPLLLVFTLLALALPGVAFAQNAFQIASLFSWIGGKVLDVAAGWTVDAIATIVNWLAVILSYFISTIFALLITFEAWLFQVLLSLNTQVVESPPVLVGFPIVLGFTNLLFVVAILVIAIATIIRKDGYEVRSTLWRLVMIAILINFGLVIASAMLEFGDSLAFFMIRSINPAGPNGDDSAAMENFAASLAGAFSPQKLYINNTVNVSAADAAARIGRPIFGLIFNLIGTGMIAVTLGGLIIMFLHRYITLAYLLVILPLAWGAYIFPDSRRHWNKWWNTFTAQLFFAPVAIFMMWLGIQMSYALATGDMGANVARFKTNAENPVYGTLSNMMGDVFVQLAGSLLDVILMVSIIGGGLSVAKKMGGAGAEAAASLAMKPMNSFQNWAKNSSKKKAADIGRGAAGSVLGGVKNSALARGDRWYNIPTAGKLAGWMQGKVGTDSTAFNKDVNEAKKKLSETTTVDQILTKINDPKFRFKNDKEMMAHLEFLKSEKALGGVQYLDRFQDEEAFKRGNRLRLQKELFKETGYNITQDLKSPGKIGDMAKSNEGLKTMMEYYTKIANAKVVADPKAGKFKDEDTLATHLFDDPKELENFRSMTNFEKKKELVEQKWDAYAKQIIQHTGDNLAPEQVKDTVKNLQGANAVNDWTERASKMDLTSNNAQLRKFLHNNPGAQTMGYHDIFNYHPPKEEKEAVILDPSGKRVSSADQAPREERRVRETVVFDPSGKPVTPGGGTSGGGPASSGPASSGPAPSTPPPASPAPSGRPAATASAAPGGNPSQSSPRDTVRVQRPVQPPANPPAPPTPPSPQDPNIILP